MSCKLDGDDYQAFGVLAKRDEKKAVRVMEEHFISAKRILQEGS
ncbi:MAG: hypothetical protein QW334_03900 [Thermofilum sp.]